MSEDKCPACGASINIHEGGFFLMGRKTVTCSECGADWIVTARISL